MKILKLSEKMFGGKSFHNRAGKERMRCSVGHGRNSVSMTSSGKSGISREYVGRWY